MKKLLLSVLSITTLSGFAQWQSGNNFTGGDVMSAFGKIYSSNLSAPSAQLSSDECGSWGGAGSAPVAMRFAYANSTNLFAFPVTASNIIYTTGSNNLWNVSSTGIIGTEQITCMCQNSVSSELLVGSTTGKVFASGNGGVSWVQKSAALAGKLITSIAAVNGTVFVGTTGGTAGPATITSIAKSTDGGITYSDASPPTGAVAFEKYINCINGNSTALYCGTNGGKIWRSTNGGAAWSQAYAIGNSSSSISIRDIYIAGPSVLVACDSGLVYSTDNGVNWTLNNNGLVTANNEKILSRVTLTANYVVAAAPYAYNGYVVRLPLSQTAIGIKEQEVNAIVSKAYPNPAHSFLNIEAQDLLLTADCSVKLHDMLGREVKTVEMTEGKATIDISGLNTGLYTYQVYNRNAVVGAGKVLVD
jgi:hypothetical protein